MTTPSERDRLLELCIAESGKGNIAALDTLVQRYGYAPQVKEQQMALMVMRYGKGKQLNLPALPAG